MRPLFLFLTLILPACCLADTGLCIETNTGTKKFVVKDNPQIKMEGADMQVRTGQGTFCFARKDITRIYFADVDAGLSAISNDVCYKLMDDAVVIEHSEPNSIVQILDLSGQLLCESKTDENGYCVLKLDEQHSVNIVKTQSITFKFIR